MSVLQAQRVLSPFSPGAKLQKKCHISAFKYYLTNYWIAKEWFEACKCTGIIITLHNYLLKVQYC